MPPAKLVNPVLWQVTQSAEVEMWFAGLETGATPVKDWPLWHVVQPDAIPV